MLRRFEALFVGALTLAACSGGSNTVGSPAPDVGVLKRNLDGTETVSLTASQTAPAAAESVDFVAKAPVIPDPSLISQTIEGTWDSHFKLSGPPTIPEDWSLTYFAGSTQLGAAPTTPTEWTSVTRIRATGTYQSDGAFNGSQYVVGTTDAAAPPAATSFSGGSAGDGWNVFFSPDRSKVYNVHHHDGPATVMCRNTSDGSTCSAGWPFALYHTSNRSTGWIDPTNLHLWHETYNNSGKAGWQCVDTSGATPAACATPFVEAFSGANSYDHHVELQNVGRELYSMDALNGRLTCLDLDGNGGAGAPCAGQPYATFGGTNLTISTIKAVGGKIYVLANSVIKCFDPATKAACAGMSWPQNGSQQPLTAVPSSDGVVRNICSEQNCYALDGTTHTLPSSYITYVANNPGCCGGFYAGSDSGGTRAFHAEQFARVHCFDMATSAACPGFPLPVPVIYAPVVDPLNANCLWTNSDDGVIRTWDVPSATAGCTSPPPISSFRAAVAVPRLACSGSTPKIGAWDTFTLTHPDSADFTSAELTIKDSSGMPITGWTGLTLDGNHPLNLATLDVALTGQAPSFEVEYTGLTDLSTPSAKFRVLGQSPEVCWTSTAETACPSEGGLLPTPLPATSPTSVTASGSVALEAQSSVAFNPTTVNITAPNETNAQTCGASLGGTFTGPSEVPIGNATVELLDAANEPVLDGSTPIVATTGEDGTYAFPQLLVGSYRIRVTTIPDYWAVSTATVVTGGTGTTNAANEAVISNVITLTSNLTGQANATFTGPLDNDGDGIPNYIEKGPDPENPLDGDGDGVPDYEDLDADNDGILDVTERGSNSTTPRDTDGDLTPDYMDRDSDGDEIPDAYEAFPGRELSQDGSVAGLVSTNGVPRAVQTSDNSGVLNYTANDQNNDGTPDYLSGDSDGDKISDRNERGSSGLPINTDSGSDTGDDIPDYLDLDSDGDSIPDEVEADFDGSTTDTDEDGQPDRIDLDSDADGIPDKIEVTGDPDGDDVPNYRDRDSDGDGVSDLDERNVDADDDGTPNYLDLDSDDDTIPDAIEQGARQSLLDTDEDAIPDFLDDDSDGDGILDSVEVGSNGQFPRDSDSDTIPDYLDPDSDGDSIPDSVEKGTGSTPVDTDQDGTPNYRDTDSDNDGVSDKTEAGTDGASPRNTDGDSLPDYIDLDSDNDGIPDSVESLPRTENPNPPPDFLEADTDGDGIPDLIDTDSDNDGILDALETVSDPDRDNIGNWRDPDSDGDLIPDALETDGDDDGDNVPNYLDGDSDNDGVKDVLELGTDPENPRDTDGDNIPDYLDDDADNDCLPDRLETRSGLLSATAPNAIASDNCTEAGNDRCDTTLGLCTRGCAADSDCGNATSGSICDDNTHSCAPGCRSDGNKCESGAVCSVANGGPGKCLVDTDGDGIPDEVEEERGLNPNVVDSDGDGIPDSVEAPDGVLVDTDRDGIPDALDTDADGDGIADSLEIGGDPMHPRDTDRDGIPDYLDLDGDGDGWPDSVEKAEDTDGDGIPDYMDTDSDGDGVSDADEFAWGFHRNKTDSDGDAISDADEVGPGPGALDTDGDGRPDAIDLDSDNDGLPDSVERGDGESPADSDGDGIPDYRDLDSDNDGISDANESRDSRDQIADSDGDGIYDYLDTDSDNDSLSDESEGNRDTDNDGAPDFRDLDSDNDCLSDQAEAADQTQRDASKPNQLASDNCPGEAPICAPQTGSCITAERTPPRECTQDNALSVCVSGQCDSTTSKCVPVGCSSDAACGAGMYCDGNTMTCVMQLSAGDKLRSDEIHGGTCTNELAAKMCESGVCNSFTNRCADKDGAGCTQASECASNACLDGVCVSNREVPTVNRLSGGCSALYGATSDNAWALLSVLGSIGIWLRRRRRVTGPNGKKGARP